jgi:co-chaperonin GroES (HSP10)
MSKIMNLDGAPLQAKPVVTRSTATAAVMKLECIDPDNVVLLEYRVLLRVVEVAEITDGGIFKPESFFERQMFDKTEAVFIAGGSEAFTDSNGAPIENRPQKGDRVITTKYAGNVYRDADNNLYRFANDKDVVAIVRA